MQPPGEKPNPRLSVIKGDDVELRCRAEADQLLDMAYKWRLNGLTIRYFQLKQLPGHNMSACDQDTL